MQTALSLRKPSVNSLAASVAIALALTAGVSGVYWLETQRAPITPTSARPAATVLQGPAVPAHDMPDSVPQTVQVPAHDMPQDTGAQPIKVPDHDMPEQAVAR